MKVLRQIASDKNVVTNADSEAGVIIGEHTLAVKNEAGLGVVAHLGLLGDDGDGAGGGDADEGVGPEVTGRRSSAAAGRADLEGEGEPAAG
jgi:hypothetical protein